LGGPCSILGKRGNKKEVEKRGPSQRLMGARRGSSQGEISHLPVAGKGKVLNPRAKARGEEKGVDEREIPREKEKPLPEHSK